MIVLTVTYSLMPWSRQRAEAAFNWAVVKLVGAPRMLKDFMPR